MDKPEYLGDGVYATNDGHSIRIDTRAQHPVNVIHLEPGVLLNLVRYAKREGTLHSLIRVDE